MSTNNYWDNEAAVLLLLALYDHDETSKDWDRAVAVMRRNGFKDTTVR
jgi:hypothetical protein